MRCPRAAIRVTAVGCLLVFGWTIAPSGARAQEATVVALVQQLAARPDATSTARELMTRALAEWDRQLQSLRAETMKGLPADVAFERHLSLGLAYRRRGRVAEALQQFDLAAALRPGTSDVHVLQGLTLEAMGRSGDAGRTFHAAWAQDPDSPLKAHLVVTRAPDVGDTERQRAVTILHRTVDSAAAGTLRAVSAPFLVVDLIPDASSSGPVVGQGTAALVFRHLAEGRLDEAVATLESGDDATASGPSALARGREAEAAGRVADARRAYSEAAASALAGRYALHVAIGRLAQVQGDSDGAVAAFREAARLNPNAALVHRELAGAYVVADRADLAFAELVAALVIAPDDAETLASIGQLLTDTGRATEALAVLRRALAVRPERYQTHYALATALSRAGRRDEAARAFARFEELNRQALDARRTTVAGSPGVSEGAK
jgi:tetratricopeptide (TPR) repeat protein